MKIGIDATSLTRQHGGGKEQVLLNLLSGIHELGIGRDYVIFCYEYAKERLERCMPEAEYVILKELKGFKKLPGDLLVKTFQLPKMVKKLGLSVLLFPMPNTGLRKYRIPTVVIPHDLQVLTNRFSIGERMKYGLIYRIDFYLRSSIVAISEYDRQDLIQYFPQHKGKFQQIYNPIKMPNLLKETNGPKGSVKEEIIAINIRYKHKNIETLIHAFRLIQDRIPHNLVLVGEMKEETMYLKSLVEALKLENRIVFTGFVSEHELFERLSSAALYVNPSTFEGFGMTAVEAMFLGVPTLVSDVCASREVTQNMAYYYKPATDCQALSDRIFQILHHQPSRDDLMNIQLRMKATYDYRVIANQYHQFLMELCL